MILSEFFGLSLMFGDYLGDLQTVIGFATYSLGRMFIAMSLSLVFALSYGIAAAKYKRAERIMITILDILQSVPILGFFPIAIFFLIAIFGETGIGVEVAAIFLITTSMVWNMTYAVYESMLTIPNELNEVSSAFNLSGWNRVRRILLPSAIPKLVFNMILSWSNGWYFLVAAEIISLGAKTYTLPGIGSFLAFSTYGGDLTSALTAVVTLIIIIFTTDLIIWRPLEALSERFKNDTISEESTTRGIFKFSRRAIRFSRFPIPDIILSRMNWIKPLFSGIIHFLINTSGEVYAIIFRSGSGFSKNITKSISLIVLAVIISVVFLAVTEASKTIVDSASVIFTDRNILGKIMLIPAATLASLARLTVALLISLAWTSIVAVKIARSRKSLGIGMPIFQTAAAVPPTAFFPFIIVLFIDLPYGLEIAAILLTATGMQWYLLFNLIAGVRSIPSDVDEVAKSINLRGIGYWKKILFPSIYPSLVTGSITAWGGGWNALIISEFVIFGGDVYSVLGLGALLDDAAYVTGNAALLLIVLVCMVITIVLIDKVFWHRLYLQVEDRSKN